ncbi:MAG: leucine-rich repeat protein [Alistipes sp.]|nr:leucine-rich repeat protein [Alistipes sp.]
MTRRIFTLFVSLVATISVIYAQCPSDEIWYTTTDGKIVDISPAKFRSVKSNTYSNGKGVIKFTSELYAIGEAYIMGDNVTQIILTDLENLETITIPDDAGFATSAWNPVPTNPFKGCPNLKHIYWVLASEDGKYVIDDMSGGLVTVAPAAGLKSFTIPDEVGSIAGDAFDCCKDLISIKIPSSVEYVRGVDFKDCINLQKFSGKFASSDGRCLIQDGELIKFAPAGLTSYTIPNGVKQIKKGAFAGCTNLARINFPKEITEVEEGTFEDCTNLKNITINTNSFQGSWVNKEVVEEITLGPNINLYNSENFNGFENLKKINIDTNQLRDNSSDFVGFEEITIGPNVTQLPSSILSQHEGKLTFNCKEITKSLTANLKTCEIYIGENVEYIASDAFSGYPGIALAGKYICDAGNSVIVNNRFVHLLNKDLESYTIPNNVTEISKEAFKGCSKLKNLTIPNGITKFGNQAFNGCIFNSITVSAVTGNKLPNDILDHSKIVKYTGKYASEDGHCLVNGSTLVDFVTTEDITYNIPNGMTKISANAFAECKKLHGVTIPDSVKSIEQNAFKGCSNLKTITITNGATIASNAFEGCPIDTITVSAVTGNELPNNIFDPINIIAYTGKNASEDGMCLINEGALVDFVYLGQTEYSIPAGITTVNAKVFANCISLNTLTLPDSITSIGEEAFTGCMNLKTINCMATTPPSIGNLAISEDVKILVPKESVKLYKENPDWLVYKKQIKAYKEAK